jgi:hypothetical protein
VISGYVYLIKVLLETELSGGVGITQYEYAYLQVGTNEIAEPVKIKFTLVTNM